MKRVAVLGGGIAGLSAAHQLVKWNKAAPGWRSDVGGDAVTYDVTVFEARGCLDGECGGKARSFTTAQPIGKDREGELLGEHGFRFFPGFYKNVIETMSEIPCHLDDPDGPTVDKQLVPLRDAAFYALGGDADYEGNLVARAIANELERFAAPLSILWLFVLPAWMILEETSRVRWVLWAAVMVIWKITRWCAEARAVDPNLEMQMAVPTGRAGEDLRNPYVAFFLDLPLFRWWWIPILVVLAFRVSWPVAMWVLVGVVCAIWFFIPLYVAVAWMWKKLRREMPAELRPRAFESMYAFLRVALVVSSCDSRLVKRWENQSWWSYVQAWRFSRRYRVSLATGLTRTFVATRAEEMSARTGGVILGQLLYDMCPYLAGDRAADRVLNGPTSDVWIDPWVQYLKSEGVKFNRVDDLPDALQPDRVVVQQILLDERGTDPEGAARIAGFTYLTKPPDPNPSAEAEAPQKIVGQFDEYILAVSGTSALTVLANSPEVLQYDRRTDKDRPTHPLARDGVPCLDGVFGLQFGWMNGLVYHLDEPIDGLPSGHILCLESDWALTAIEQLQHWRAAGNPAAEGDHVRRGAVLSVNISDFFKPGSTGLPALYEDFEAIRTEVWNQLGQHIRQIDGRATPPPAVADEALEDPDLPAPPPPTHEWMQRPLLAQGRAGNLALANREKLLINTAGSWDDRPCAVTTIANLRLAGDYVRTHVDFASMEAADEAARWAVHDLVAADNPSPDGQAPVPEPKGLEDPRELRVLLRIARGFDWVFYKFGLPNPVMVIATPFGWFARIEDKFRDTIEDALRPGHLRGR